MKVYAVILFILMILPLASAESLEISGNYKIPTISNGVVTDHNGNEYSIQSDGTYKIEYDIYRIPIIGVKLSSKITYIAFGVNGNYNGGTNFNKITTDYNWITTSSLSGNEITLISVTPNNEWTTEFLFTPTRTKVTNKLKNTLSYQINDSNFYYLFTVDKEDTIDINTEKGKVKDKQKTISIDNKNIPYVSINDNLLFDYNDLIMSNFNMTELHIRNAKDLGFSSYNKDVIALQFHKDEEIIEPEETIVFDPSIDQVGGTLTLDGTHTYDYVNLSSGAILYVSAYNGTGTTGMLNLTVNYEVNVDGTSSINGDTRGFLGGSGGVIHNGGSGGTGTGKGGNGAGSADAGGGGGGSGYGTIGEVGATAYTGEGGSAGSIYGTTDGQDISMGSGAGGGGGGSGTACSATSGEAGGAMISIIANSINIHGTINFDGGSGGTGGCGAYGGGAGGSASGGGIKLNGTNVNISSANIYTRNSAGTTSTGGGRVKIFYIHLVNTSTTISSGTVYYYSFNSAPTVPVLTSHANYHNTGATTVTWTASTDPDGDPITYDVKVGTTSGGTNILNYAGDTDTTSNSFTMTPTNTYYWSVRACDPYTCSNWATESSFAFANSVPTVPTIVRPIYGSYHWNGTMNATWTTSTDSDGDTVRYNWQMATDSGFTTGLVQANITANYSSSQSTTNGNTYYLRVNATDGYGYSSYSTTYIFYEKVLAVPVITFPTNNSNQNNFTLNVTYTASVIPPTILHNFQLSTSSTFATIDYQGNATNNTYTGLVTPLNNKTYYLRIKSNMSTQGQVSNWSNTVVFHHVRNETVAVYPENGSTSTTTAIYLAWTDGYQATPYTWYLSTNSDVSSPIASGSEATITSALKNSSVNELEVGTKYYWRVMNSTGVYSDIFNFTTSTAATTPGRFNITVFDENNLSIRILNFTVQLYNSTSVVTKSTIDGWTNFTSENVSSGEYLIIVTPINEFSNYYPRMILNDSPNTVSMYVPNSTSPNTLNLISFSIYDITGLFPYQTSTISVTKGGLLMDKSYFATDGTHPVYLLQGNNYQIEVQHGTDIFYGNNFVPSGTASHTITINDFTVNSDSLLPFYYNITDTSEQIVLNWIDRNNVLDTLNFTVRKGSPMVLVCQQTSSLTHGQSICSIDNTTSFYVIFSARMDDGTFQNTSYSIDYTIGQRKSSTGTSSIDSSPIGIGYSWNYGDFVMPDWIYNYGSLILIILLAGSFGGYHSGFGGILVGIVALILEVKGFFRPLGDSDAAQLVVMGITGGLLFLTVLYYLQHKEKGG